MKKKKVSMRRERNLANKTNLLFLRFSKLRGFERTRRGCNPLTGLLLKLFRKVQVENSKKCGFSKYNSRNITIKAWNKTCSTLHKVFTNDNMCSTRMVTLPPTVVQIDDVVEKRKQ